MSSQVTSIERVAAPLRRQVLQRLRDAIIAGELAPGVRLVERDLCDRLAVSRTVVREVLRQLESEGLVAIVPNRGPVVRALSLEEARELYAIRAVLEGLAARRFAEHATGDEIERVRAAVAEVAEAYGAADPARVVTAKERFYDLLHAGARAEVLAGMIASLHARIARWRMLGLTHPDRSPGRSGQSVAALAALVAAITRRDPREAERLARAEADDAAAEVFRLLGATGAAPGGRVTPP